tara:strand:- start:481 stop:1389 length:909 start_codon:yes stop_codon:yes gene_type:complete
MVILFIARSFLKSEDLNISSTLKSIFYLHGFAVLLCYIFPPINQLFISIFGYSSATFSGGSIDRISGFIQGYDFVSYFFIIYLAYEYLNNNKKLDKKYIFKLFIGISASLMSGRYSFIPISLLLLFIASNGGRIILKTNFLVITSIIFVSIFPMIFENIFIAINIMKDLFLHGFQYDFAEYSSEGRYEINVDGQYNLSPVQLIQESIRPFLNWNNHILPSKNVTIDPGPSYMILNLGFLIAVYLYLFFFKVIKYYLKESVPLIVFIIFLSIDIKFRSLYALFPTCWLIVNHINYIKHRKQIS